MNIEGFALLAGAAGSIVWLLWGIGRLNEAWAAAQKRKVELDQKRVDMAMQLMKLGEELMRLKGTEAGDGERLTALQALCTQKQKELAEFVPPPPPEILVTSEYAASKEDRAWLVLAGRGAAARPSGSANGAAAQKQYLLWATDHNAALNRARHVVSDEPGYEIMDVHRYA